MTNEPRKLLPVLILQPWQVNMDAGQVDIWKSVMYFYCFY